MLPTAPGCLTAALPQVLNKYVGASEENIRNLFKDAEADFAKMGEASGELGVVGSGGYVRVGGGWGGGAGKMD